MIWTVEESCRSPYVAKPLAPFMAPNGRNIGKPEPDPLPRPSVAAVPTADLFLALAFDQFQHPELLLGDIRQRDRQPDALRVEDSETPPHESATRRVHRLFEQILRAARPMADVDAFPIRAASGAAIQFRLRRVAALPASEDAVGALFLGSAQPALVQHRPDQESHARILRPVAGRRYSGSSSASMASCAITSETAADLCTMGTAPA
jgi:hypothetical protein